jgi:hypothetical protein
VLGNAYINHLQPNNCLERGINIEVRNDNDSRFSALIQEFLKRTISTKYLHIHIRHKKMVILKVFMRFWQKTTPFYFWSIDELEEVLTLFYENTIMNYIHRCNLPPNIFFRMLEQRTNRTKQRRNKMEDKIQTQDTL